MSYKPVTHVNIAGASMPVVNHEGVGLVLTNFGAHYGAKGLARRVRNDLDKGARLLGFYASQSVIRSDGRAFTRSETARVAAVKTAIASKGEKKQENKDGRE